MVKTIGPEGRWTASALLELVDIFGVRKRDARSLLAGGTSSANLCHRSTERGKRGALMLDVSVFVTNLIHAFCKTIR